MFIFHCEVLGLTIKFEVIGKCEDYCATYNDVNKFQIDGREFLVTLLENNNPISFSVVKYASVQDPKVLVLQPLNLCKSLFQKLLFTLINLKIICSSQADLAVSEFLSFYHTSLRERKTSFECFQKEHDCLDDFYVKETNMCNM